MTKQEFEARIGKEINLDDYSLIEYVYTWHPSIDGISGKDQIAFLYVKFGMRIIKDMVGTANKVRELEEERLELQQKINQIDAEYEKMKS